jgi:ABC-type multidrug transport system fused ATPase/permease subunit
MSIQSDTAVEPAAPQQSKPHEPPASAPTPVGRTPSARRRRQIVEYLFGFSRWRAPLLALLSVAAGLTEAAVLAIVAQIGAALATRGNAAETHLGIASINMSIRAMLELGVAIAAARVVLLVPASLLAARLSADAEATLRSRLFSAFLRASWPAKADDREGTLQELMTNQISQATTGVIQTTWVVTYLFSLLALVASALVLSPVAAGVVVGVSCLLFALLRPLSRAGSRSARDLSSAQLAHASGVSEATRLAEETQVFGVAEPQRSSLQQLIDRARYLLYRSQATVRLVPNLYQSGVYLMLMAGLALIYAFDRSGLAALGAVVLVLVRAGTYGNQAQTAYQVVKQSIPFVNRVLTAIDRYEDAATAEGSKPFETLDTLSFQGISYSYGNRSEVLHDFTFDVQAGETIGIIGPSGTGKSTLAQLLLRLREPDAGEYLVNGAPASSLRWTDWATKAAYVPQTPQLIYASVADNIRYFRDVSTQDVEHAAQLAGIHEDISSWSDGYDTIVGPRAAAVSVGQAQRICLARALTLHPQILVLDEPTSALDPASERLIQASLTALRGSLTLFVIAHRLSTLDICDRVMVVVDGRLDAFESFDDLQRRNAYYRSATTGLG